MYADHHVDGCLTGASVRLQLQQSHGSHIYRYMATLPQGGGGLGCLAIEATLLAMAAPNNWSEVAWGVACRVFRPPHMPGGAVWACTMGSGPGALAARGGVEAARRVYELHRCLLQVIEPRSRHSADISAFSCVFRMCFVGFLAISQGKSSGGPIRGCTSLVRYRTVTVRVRYCTTPYCYATSLRKQGLLMLLRTSSGVWVRTRTRTSYCHGLG